MLSMVGHLGFGKTPLSRLIAHYLRYGNKAAALLLYFFAVRRRATISELVSMLRKSGLNVDTKALEWLLVNWRVHRYIADVARGVYELGPNLEINKSEIEKTRELLCSYGLDPDSITRRSTSTSQ